MGIRDQFQRRLAVKPLYRQKWANAATPPAFAFEQGAADESTRQSKHDQGRARNATLIEQPFAAGD
jgi:hypothetical protein